MKSPFVLLGLILFNISLSALASEGDIRTKKVYIDNKQFGQITEIRTRADNHDFLTKEFDIKVNSPDKSSAFKRVDYAFYKSVPSPIDSSNSINPTQWISLSFGSKSHHTINQAVDLVLPGAIHSGFSQYESYQRSQALSEAMAQNYQKGLDSLVSAHKDYVLEREKYNSDQMKLKNGHTSIVAGHYTSLVPAQDLDFETIQQKIKLVNSSKDIKSNFKYNYSIQAFNAAEAEVINSLETNDYSTLKKYANELSNLEAESVQTIGKDRIDQLLGKFTNGEILQVSKIRDDIEPSFLDGAQFLTHKDSNSRSGTIRRLANDYQVSWMETDALTTLSQDQKSAFALGSSYLFAADFYYNDLHYSQGDSLLELSQSLLDFSRGFKEGVSESLESLINSIPETYDFLKSASSLAYNDPDLFLEKSYQALLSVPKVADAILTAMTTAYDKLVYGSAEDKGEVIGGVALDIVAAISTGGVLKVVKTAAQGSKAFKALSKASNNFKTVIKSSPGLTRAVKESVSKFTSHQIFKTPASVRTFIRKTAAKNPIDAVKITSALNSLKNIDKLPIKLKDKFYYFATHYGNNFDIETGSVFSTAVKNGFTTNESLSDFADVVSRIAGPKLTRNLNLNQYIKAKVFRYSSINPGPLHHLMKNGSYVSSTFRGHSYFKIRLAQPTKLYRVYSRKNFELSQFWSREKPSGPFQATIDSALDPNWGNKATKWVEITIPAGEEIYEGIVSPVLLKRGKFDKNTGQLLGGGSQVYLDYKVPDDWITDRGDFL